jgi:hypothetical protein
MNGSGSVSSGRPVNDNELRDRFDQWAAPLRTTEPPPLAGIRGRARRRTARLAAAAGAAVAVVAIAVSLSVTSLTAGSGLAPARSGLWGSSTYPAPPGEPYVFVNAAGTSPAELRDAATGAVIKVVRPLAGAVDFTSAAASADDRVFVLAQQDGSSQVSFAELRIDSGGGARPPAVRLVPVLTGASLPAGSQVYFMAVNAAATRLAFESVAGDGTSSILVVYDLSNDRLIGQWPTGTGGVVAPPQFVRGTDELVAQWVVSDTRGSGPGRRGSVYSRHIVLQPRLINTMSAFPAGSSLLADSGRVHGLDATSGVLSADGSVAMATLDGSLDGSANDKNGIVRLAEYSTSSGRLLYRIPVGPASALQSQYFCGVLWASANGRDLLTQCGSRQQEVADGKVTEVKLAWTFAASQSLATVSFAW